VNRSSGLAALWVGVVITAVYGPYTSISGLRTEQLAVYGSVALALPLVWRIRPTRQTLTLSSVWTVYALVGLLGALWPITAVAYGPGNTLAGLDNLALPLAVLLLAQLWLSRGADPIRLLRVACGVTVVAMCINAILAVASTYLDLTPLLSQFWGNEAVDPSTETVAGLSAQLGRATGLVNQPAEAGSLYGIALLAAIYVLRDKPTRLAAAILLLVVGGVITVSKVFLLVGLPIASWQLLRLTGDRRRRIAVVGGSLLLFAVGAGQAGLIDEWHGSRFLAHLWEPAGGLLEYYTGQRLGESSYLVPIIEYVLRDSPALGMGAAGLFVPYDNGWVEALVIGGVVGAIAYSLTLLLLIHAWWMQRFVVPQAESMLGGGLVLLAMMASFGFSPLTANRVATVLWVLLALTVLARPAAFASRSYSISLRGRVFGPSRYEPAPSNAPTPTISARRIYRGW